MKKIEYKYSFFCRIFALYIFFNFITLMPAYAKNGDALEWVGVEVVTNDFEIIDDVVKLSGIKSGDEISIDSPILPNACNFVRAGYPSRSVNCTAILMEKAQALYVIQVSKDKPIKTNVPLCKPMSKSVDYLNFESSIIADMNLDVGSKNSTWGEEFINKDEILDTSNKERHLRLIGYLEHTLTLKDEIKSFLHSCDPIDRRNAIYAYNFLGDAHEAIVVALTGIYDEDIIVRNVSLRLLSSFAAYIPDEYSSTIINNSCKIISKETFFERNKGLMILLSMTNKNSRTLSNINQKCRNLILKIAGSSKSEQIGIPANTLVDFFKKNP
ncbi:hypothetical protein FHI69_22475 [Janthinobacterium lividum]|uniref:Uncharacterized protein n=1 Tax=Janthinobacterium lividum TaxID=29581 RepID=A0A5C4NKL7_9BURK|nr:hypothetical protein [Janthinobacterium lividum]TNC73938.1 hypothetical protein FHI69_22475 [Janthinobacterium lividum]